MRSSLHGILRASASDRSSRATLSATIRQLEIFQAIYLEGGFASAATRLGVTQPAVSKQIQALEARLGFPLFIRKRGVAAQLTTYGSAVIGELPSLMRSAASISSVREQRSTEHQTVRITAGRLIASRVIIPHLPRFQTLRPDITVEVTTVDSPLRTLAAPRPRDTDVTYVSVLDKRLAPMADVLCTAHMGFYASAACRAIKAKRGSLRHPLPMIMGIAGTPFDLIIIKALRNAHVAHFNIVHRVQLPEVMIGLAEMGAGICFAAVSMVKAELLRGSLLALDFPATPMFPCAVRGASRAGEAVLFADRYFRKLIVSELTST